jgi:hypothetical protein
MAYLINFCSSPCCEKADFVENVIGHIQKSKSAIFSEKKYLRAWQPVI